MAFKVSVFQVPTMVTGNSVTSALNIPGSWLYIYLVMPTMTGGYGADTQVFVQTSPDNVLPYFRFAPPQVNTSTVATNDFAISSSTTQRMVPIPGFGLNWLKIETTAVATAGVAAQGNFQVVCVSNQ